MTTPPITTTTSPLTQTSITNPELRLAFQYIQNTHQSVFLTGKAGTGKTTFLQQLKKQTPKRMIVTAPTGVAAINAGGVTLHSFFQLPFGPLLPDGEARHQASQHRFSREKTNIIKGLDLLVIDEISMVRADLLDGIDQVLRRYKTPNLAFGGVQLLMIGDLHQLAPVVKSEEWELLKPHYDSCYFFSSQALKQIDLLTIELKHIYRQADPHFVALLNRVRDNNLDSETLRDLNTRYIPGFKPSDEEDYITLSTHNRNAEAINESRLALLHSQALTYTAVIQDQYPEFAYPTAKSLLLKAGAQVMFVRNDHSAEKRYFNGKIGKITYLDENHIRVKCPGDTDAIAVEPVTWENIKYSINPDDKSIAEEIIGTFTQYPLRLAWAITIHKSQGLTFERAIIDADAAFAHGQVYVAMSRCKTFEGMVLSKPISNSVIKTDNTVSQFVSHANANPPTEQQFQSAKIHFQQALIQECFDFRPLRAALLKLCRLLGENANIMACGGIEAIDSIKYQASEEIFSVAEKFQRQLERIFGNNTLPESDQYLQERVRKASQYFTEKLQPGLIHWAFTLSFDTDNKELQKKVRQALVFLQHGLTSKMAGLHSCRDEFTPKAYLHAKATAEIETKPQPFRQPESSVDDRDKVLEHPELFHTLKKWRVQQAREEQVDPYRIIHQRILAQIATHLPIRKASLMKIKGIGKHTAGKYGAALIDIVKAYCEQHGVEQKADTERDGTKSEKKEKSKSDTRQISCQLFSGGKSVEEIAKQRGLARSTIEGHLAHFVGTGQLSISEFLGEADVNIIKAKFSELGQESLTTIREALANKYSYAELRLVKNAIKFEENN